MGTPAEIDALAPDSLARALFDVVRAGIVVMDEEGTIASVNQALCRMLGYSPEELIGQSVETLMPEPHRSRHDEYLDRYAKTGEARVIGIGRDVEALRKDGSRVWVELLVSPLTAGGKRMFCGTLRDIGAERRADFDRAAGALRLELEQAHLTSIVNERSRELAASEQFLQGTLDALSAHVAVVDERWEIVAVNRAWRVFAEENGGSSGLGDSYAVVLADAVAAGVEGTSELTEALGRVLRGELTEHVYEYPCHSPSKQRWFLLRATRFEVRGRVHLVLAHEDISAKRLAEASAEANRRAAAERARGMVPVIEDLHRSIQRYTTLAREHGRPTSEEGDALLGIQRAAARASDTLRDWLADSSVR